MCVILVFVLVGCTEENSEKEIQWKEETLVIATIIPEFEPYIEEVFAKNYNKEITTKSIFTNIDEVNNHWVDLDEMIDDYLQKNRDVDLVFGISPEYIKGLVERGSLRNLSEIIDESILNHIAPVFSEPMKKIGEGDLYAVTPTIINNYILAYNKGIFEKAGIQEPQNGMSWKEIRELSSQIVEKTDYEGFALEFPMDDGQFFQVFLNTVYPARNYQMENGKVVLNTSESRQYWTLFADLYKENSKVTGEEFMNGKVAMGVFSANVFFNNEDLDLYGHLDKSELGFVQMPVTEENPGGVMWTETIFAMSKYSNNKEAIIFLEKVHGKEFAKLLIQNSQLPTYLDSDIENLIKDHFGFDLTPALTQPGIVYNTPQFNISDYTTIRNMGEEYFLKYLNGDGDIETILAEYEKAVNEYIAK